jgi:hypothetical protein
MLSKLFCVTAGVAGKTLSMTIPWPLRENPFAAAATPANILLATNVRVPFPCGSHAGPETSLVVERFYAFRFGAKAATGWIA